MASTSLTLKSAQNMSDTSALYRELYPPVTPGALRALQYLQGKRPSRTQSSFQLTTICYNTALVKVIHSNASVVVGRSQIPDHLPDPADRPLTVTFTACVYDPTDDNLREFGADATRGETREEALLKLVAVWEGTYRDLMDGDET